MNGDFLMLGGAQHARVIWALSQMSDELDRCIGVLDDNPDIKYGRWRGKLCDMERICDDLNVKAVAIGISNRYMRLREELYNRAVQAGLRVESFIHPKAYIHPKAAIGNGCIINPGVVINAFAKVGNNFVAYSNAVVEHECVLGDNVYLGPGVNFTSNAKVGNNVFIGAGACILPDTIIGNDVVIGAGAVVKGYVPSGEAFAGVLAKCIGFSSAVKF